jgi:exopolysaccharide biosynthesis protein
MRVYLLQVDLKNPDITLEAAMPYGAAHLSNLMQPLPQMAAYYDSAGHEVVGGVNADFFDRSTAVPRGILALDGNVLKTTWWSARSATFISVLKNGQVYIGDRQDFIEKQDDLQDALGAGPELVWNGVIQSQTDQSVEPRTGAGITKDSVLYFIVADGRYFYWSNGMSLPQLGAMFKSLGAYKAVNLDGGGSSTFVIRNPVAPVIQVRNRPSDGNNRPLGNGWLVVNTKK